MSKGVNKWIGIGNLCADPEVRYTSDGMAIANVTIACGDSYKDKNTGQTVDKTEFVRLVFFKRLAEIVGEYCKKGSQVYIEGRLQTRKWQDKNGVDKYTTEVVADVMNMLVGRGGAAGSDGDYVARQGGRGGAPSPQAATIPGDGFGDLDIPF